MSRNISRGRNFALISYHSLETIKTVLTAYEGRISHWAYILHDKDTNEKGELKEPHYHLLLVFYNPLTISACRALFPIGANTLGKFIDDKSRCFTYLDHSSTPDKFQYSADAIVCDDLNYWISLQAGEPDDKTLNIIDDLCDGVSFYELARRYGRDLVVNYSRYKDFANLVLEQRRLESARAYAQRMKDRALAEAVPEDNNHPFHTQLGIID